MTRSGDEIQVHPQPVAHVRGHAAFDRPAGWPALSAALFADLSLSTAAFCVTLRILDLPPLPRLWWPLAIAAIAGAAWSLSRALLGRSLGESFWRLAPPGNAPFGVARQARLLGAGAVAAGIFLTLAAWTGATAFVFRTLERHPVLARAQPARLDPFIPPQSPAPGDEEWGIEPYYYALGAWPRTFGGRPVFLTIPYEKGPPTRFAGHVVARWQMPDIRLTYEGPKTPGLATTGERLTRDAIRGCLTYEADAVSLGCLAIRGTTLLRHLDEIKRQLGEPAQWTLRWITVSNPAIPPGEQTEGFMISALGATHAQDRFVLVTANGTHQAFSLDYVPGADGTRARRLFENAIRSLRVSDDLNPGRAWVDREIESLKLDDLEAETRADDPAALLSRISAVQALLIAKISVDPKTYDSYYHLGGMSLVLARYAANHRSTDDWVAAAKLTLQSVHRYAQDLAPDDPRTAALQGFLLEAQKY